MNKHITRIILASTSLALSSIVNVASGQVLGGGMTGGLGGAMGGGLNSVNGTLNGNGSFGGALDASTVGRTRGSLDRLGSTARDSGERVRSRARSTTQAVKNEAAGAANDAKASVTDVSSVTAEEASSLTSSATASANAAANAAGSIDAQAPAHDLTSEPATAPAIAAPDSAAEGTPSLTSVESLAPQATTDGTGNTSQQNVLGSASSFGDATASGQPTTPSNGGLVQGLSAQGSGKGDAKGQGAVGAIVPQSNEAPSAAEDSTSPQAATPRASASGAAQANANGDAAAQASL
jgi:hypothetical protein